MRQTCAEGAGALSKTANFSQPAGVFRSQSPVLPSEKPKNDMPVQIFLAFRRDCD